MLVLHIKTFYNINFTYNLSIRFCEYGIDLQEAIDSKRKSTTINLPEGTYGINDIEDYIKK